MHQPLKFKIATEDWEFELLHRLNYRTFVEEIPQHEPSPARKLVDKFHHENTYIICLDGHTLAGMIAIRSRRPFSLDSKLPNLDAYLPPGRHLCEIRLLAVEKPYRNGQVFHGLAAFLVQYGRAQGYDLAVISGTTRQQKLYRHLGFKPFGPLVGTPGAQYQPMFLTLESLLQEAGDLFPAVAAEARPATSFLPGPVAIHAEVRKELRQDAISHRSDSFMAGFQIVKQSLRQLTGAKNVEILLGSGTLANDVVGGQLTLMRKPGLVLSNGEFGDRLVDQATRFKLDFKTLCVDWGQSFDLPAIRQYLARHSGRGWLWAVHCETSTGVLNDLPGLKQLCQEWRLKLCLDCISSVGTSPVDLAGVFLASGVSGKGLGAYPGLALVFYDHPVKATSKSLPRYLDLGYYAANEGVPFTHSSNLLFALQAALRRWNPRRFADLMEVADGLRRQLREAGFSILAPDTCASPAVITLVLPPSLNSRLIGKKLQKNGFLLSYGSAYLQQRNWLQICLMGEYSHESLNALLKELMLIRPGKSTEKSLLGKSSSPARPTALLPTQSSNPRGSTPLN